MSLHEHVKREYLSMACYSLIDVCVGEREDGGRCLVMQISCCGDAIQDITSLIIEII
jgi:hypothetical protein